MKTISIGLIREGKVPSDKRVPFTPVQTEEIQQRFPFVKVLVQQSNVRGFADNEYIEIGTEVVADVSACDILMGIKEVPVDQLIADKTYLFFSHTIKMQPYNRKLLQTILQKRIKLIDYEALRDSQGNRLVAFGRYAGMVGAYNGLLTWGKRYGQFQMRRAFECYDVNDLKLELRKVNFPNIKIVLTGSGRVAKGAMEALDTAGIRKVSPIDFLQRSFNEPVYVQLGSADYHVRVAGGHFNREEFHEYPERYQSSFLAFTQVADVLLAGAFWNPKAPRLFSEADMKQPSFKIKVIADITCDINGSVPSTKRASTIVDPVYDYDPTTEEIIAPFSGDNHVTVMAIDNLPCELPRSASEEFGHDLIDRVLKPLLLEDRDGIIARGTVAENGKLTAAFRYLEAYVNE